VREPIADGEVNQNPRLRRRSPADDPETGLMPGEPLAPGEHRRNDEIAERLVLAYERPQARARYDEDLAGHAHDRSGEQSLPG
jgi:hypothetical protein